MCIVESDVFCTIVRTHQASKQSFFYYYRKVLDVLVVLFYISAHLQGLEIKKINTMKSYMASKMFTSIQLKK